MLKNFSKIFTCFVLAFVVCTSALANTFFTNTFDVSEVRLSDLPREAQATMILIKQGGPFPYDKDGVVFGNYEGRLPRHARGYYHEYTVKTPYARNRGARRIITGGERSKAQEFFYTDDHYQSFRKIRE
jgi:ribonuclease T1